MFPADAQLDIAAHTSAAFSPHLHQRTDPVHIDRDKRINRIDLRIGIGMHESASIITADAKRCLRQIIRTEREKLCLFGQTIGANRGARQFNHGADKIIDADTRLASNRNRLLINHRLADFQLFCRCGKRDHHFGDRRFCPALCHIACSLEDCTRLHAADFRICDRQPAATMAQHGIRFRQFQ